MKLYLCTYRVDRHVYMGDTVKGERDFRLVWANHPDEAHNKLVDVVAPGSARLPAACWLHDFEAHEAIT